LRTDDRSLTRLCPQALGSRREEPPAYRANDISGEWRCLAQRPDILNDALRRDRGLDKYLTATQSLDGCGRYRATSILWRTKLPEDDALRAKAAMLDPDSLSMLVF
jgi:hypothetical protein